jgi:foldase protein PrsA
MHRPATLCLIVAILGTGCQSAPAPGSGGPRATAVDGDAVKRSGRVLAYVGSEPLTTDALLPALIEAGGGATLSESVLDAMLRRRLEATGQSVGPAQIDAERQALSQTLSDDENEAARLIGELRRLRNLGPVRFEQLLWRNAALRKLVADRVTVAEPAVQREYRLTYGPSSRVRLLMQPTLSEAQAIKRRYEAGEAPFGELAALHSTDSSAAQGGLLSPIRPDDPTYPEALRNAANRLEPGQVSPPVALDGGFALIYLDEKISGAGAEAGVSFEQVEAELRAAVRLRAERVLMQRLARELTAAADVVVLDPTLKAAWEDQRRALLNTP